MSNEVNKDAEGAVENQASAVEPNKNAESTEKAIEAITGAEAPQPPENQKESEAVTGDETSVAKVAPIPEVHVESKDVTSEEKQLDVAEVPKTPDAQPESKDVQAESNTETGIDTGSDDGQNQGEMDFGAMLAQFEEEQVAYHAGETVNGKVVRISDQGVLIDFGYKSEGVVPIEEFTDSEGNPTITKGEDVDVVIKNIGGDGAPMLSFVDAKNQKSWDEIEKAFRDDAIVKGVIRDKTKGGLKVDVNGVEAFLPGSQIDSRPVRNLDALRGQEIETKVVKFSRKRNNIVLSRKVITDQVINKQKAETLKKIEVGYIVDGTVKNLTEYGAFIDIGGIDGLLHVTDMSWGRLHRPGDLLQVNDSVQVKVLKLDREREKISLGYKQLLPDPWSTVIELYPVESKIKGKISSVTEYGAFVELEPGVEGLVHVSEMSWAKRMKHPKHFVNKGDEVEVLVLGIDPDERRISLGIKQLQANPWDTIGQRYQVGSKVHGKVRNLTDFGAFVEIEDGVDGLVHVSDISWSKKVKHPKDVLKKGQEVEAIVTNIDTQGHRLSLSIKELTPSGWETFTSEHKPGDVVKGKISRFAGFGIFVELAPDLEGLCHISELSDDRIENPESEFEIGQELDFKILRIEQDVEKIGLSARAVGKEDKPGLETKTYSSEAKGGMASLGELANLRIGRSEDNSQAEATESVDKVETPEAKAEASETGVAEKAAGEGDEKPESKEIAVAEKTEETAADETGSSEAKVEDDNEAVAKESGETALAEKTEDAADASDSPEDKASEETDQADEKKAPKEEPIKAKAEEVKTEKKESAKAKAATAKKKPAKKTKAKATEAVEKTEDAASSASDSKEVEEVSEATVEDKSKNAESAEGEAQVVKTEVTEQASEKGEEKSKSKKAES